MIDSSVLLPEPGSADDGHRLALVQREMDVVENGQHAGGVADLLGDVFDFDEG